MAGPAELPAVVVGLGGLHHWNWHCPACGITQGARDQQDAINGRKEHLDAHRFAIHRLGGAITIRPDYEGFTFVDPPAMKCALCKTCFRPPDDLYDAVRMASDHYAKCRENG